MSLGQANNASTLSDDKITAVLKQALETADPEPSRPRTTALLKEVLGNAEFKHTRRPWNAKIPSRIAPGRRNIGSQVTKVTC